MMTKSLPSCSVLEYRFQDGICRRCVVIMVASINDMKEANDLACVRPFPSQHSDVNTLIHKDDLADTNVQPELRTEAKMKRVCARVLINVQQHLCLRSGGCKFHDRGWQAHRDAPREGVILHASPGRMDDIAVRQDALPDSALALLKQAFLLCSDVHDGLASVPWKSEKSVLQSCMHHPSTIALSHGAVDNAGRCQMRPVMPGLLGRYVFLSTRTATGTVDPLCS